MAALSLCLLLVVGSVAWVTIGPGRGDDDGPYVVPTPTSSAPRVDPGGADRSLQRLVDALRRGDADAAAAQADPELPTAVDALHNLGTVAAAARLDDLELRYVDEQSGIDANGVWAAAVDVAWRFRGFDQVAARSEVEVTFRLQPDGGVAIAGVGGAALRTPVWMSGDVTVRRSRHALVLASGSAAVADRYLRLADRAVPVVKRVLPRWRTGLVVEVPADLTALDRALEAREGEYAQIAAVTVGPDGSTAPRSPVHVFINPDVFTPLRGEAAQVVLSHEATHVAGDGPRSQAPTWLVEGFADYVALRDVDLPLHTTASQIAHRVQQQGLPDHLPTAADFDPDLPDLGAEYEAAWLLCVTLASHGGQQALVTLYDRLSAGRPMPAQLQDLFGWTPAEALSAWRDRLSDLPS